MQFNNGRRLAPLLLGRTTRFARPEVSATANWPEGIVKKDYSNITSNGFEDGFVAFARVGNVEFPEPDDQNVNMMPLIFGHNDSLPDDLQCYFHLIEQCPYLSTCLGKVGYLTVHESYVNIGDTQRQGELHIEMPGVVFHWNRSSSFTPGVEHGWGNADFI